MDFQLLDGEEVIPRHILRVLEVDHPRGARCDLAVGSLDRHLDPVANKKILFFVDLHVRRGGETAFEFLLRLVDLGVGDPRIELLERAAEVADEQDVAVTPPPEGAVGTEDFGIVGVGDLPAELFFQQLARALLHQNVFRVLVTHSTLPSGGSSESLS